MNDLHSKFEAIELLVGELRQHQFSDSKEMEHLLSSILELIRDVAERETTEITLRNANEDLQTQLQAQLEENKRTQALEREQRVLTEALRDTIVTMSSTLDLNKVLDQILDTVGRVTPYDGANILFVESDLVHVVRQRGYVGKGEEQGWLGQRIPITK